MKRSYGKQREQQLGREMVEATRERNFCARPGCGHGQNDWHFDVRQGAVECTYPGCQCPCFVFENKEVA